ncbi:hypothetical protein NVSP9465_01814 [Novosphingobium sp. CECT 9465]|nr:hypothetical protein NVSP9465_01814 [Novosphingobium sp. CECT 9465]
MTKLIIQIPCLNEAAQMGLPFAPDMIGAVLGQHR